MFEDSMTASVFNYDKANDAFGYPAHFCYYGLQMNNFFLGSHLPLENLETTSNLACFASLVEFLTLSQLDGGYMK